MKKFVLAALVGLMAAPAFANENLTVMAEGGDEAAQELFMADDTQADEGQLSEDRQWGRRQWTCRVSGGRWGRTFYGRDWSRDRAYREAMYS